MEIQVAEMRAVRCVGGGIAVVDVSAPTGQGVRVRVASAGICGSDLAMVASTVPPTVTIGHEISGTLDDGTPVAVEAVVSCHKCSECVAGRYNACNASPEGPVIIGIRNLDGGMADEVLVPERSLVQLPPGLSIRDAFLVEPLAAAMHGLRLAGVQSGECVGVVGAGSIGLLTVAAAHSLGAEVVLIARYAHQAAAGEARGATFGGDRCDVVVNTAGSRESISQAGTLLRPGGTLVLVAGKPEDVPFVDLSNAVTDLTLIRSAGYNSEDGRRDVDEAAQLLAQTPEIPLRIITHRFPLENADIAFRVAIERQAGAIKVVLEP